MTSVADIPGDADDDLSEISPELVLVDPELARIMRERQPDVGRRPAIVQTLRLVPAADEDEGPIVPRPTATNDAAPQQQTDLAAPTAPPGADQTARGESTNGRPPDVSPAPTSPTPERPVAEEPAALVPATRIVDAEPARVVEQPVVAPVPLPSPEAVAAALAPPAAAVPPLPSPPATAAAMPHPIARPERSHRTVRERERRSRRGRGVLAFIAAVAVASVVTLGILNLADGSSSSSAPTAKAPISGGPTKSTGQAAKQAKSRANATSTAKPGSRKRPRAGPRPKTTVTPKRTTTTKPKPKSAAKPKVPVNTKPSATVKPKPKETANPKPAAAAPATEARRFAWAPVDGAVSYHVELFKGADRVLAKETTQPILELGATWRYEGKTVQLTPGTYRWYVWPVTKSGRATRAVVQAKLDIP